MTNCLNGLINQTFPHFNIIVVDDNGKIPVSNTIEKFRTKLSITCLRNSEQKGAAYSRNVALDLINEGIIGLLDDDAVPFSNWVEEALRYFDFHPEISCIVGKINSLNKKSLLSKSRQRIYDDRDRFFKNPTTIEALGSKFKNRYPWNTLPADYISGGNAWIRYMENIRFPNDILWGHDHAFARKIMESGNLIAYDPDLQIYHDHEHRFFHCMIKGFKHGYYSELGKAETRDADKLYKTLSPAWKQLLKKPTREIPLENILEPFHKRIILSFLTFVYYSGVYLAKRKKLKKA